MFHLVLSGCCRIDTGSRTFTLREGDFVLFPRDEARTIHDPVDREAPTTKSRTPHDDMLPLSQTSRGAADVDLLCGCFVHEHGSTTLFARILPDPLHALLTDSASPTVLQALTGLMRDEAETRVPDAPAIVISLSQALLTVALRAYGQRENASSDTLTLLPDARLGPSIQAILNAPKRAWTIDVLAGLAAILCTTYVRHLRTRADVAVWGFFTRVHVVLACETLVHAQLSMGRVSTHVDCQSEAAFGKTLKQQSGVTPTRYRKRLVNYP